jgi:glycosyltransferase involved in cell wall biosynthesis
MRIAQIAPLFEAVPPRLYGGTERIVSYLTEELVRQGQDVTLFASGDSVTSARLVSTTPGALRLNPDAGDALAHHFILLKRLREMQHQFDVVHFHTDYLHYLLVGEDFQPHLTTVHGRQDLPELACLHESFPDMPLVSCSQAQQLHRPAAGWLGSVYHGLPSQLYRPLPQRDEYLAFIGRISPEKRVDRAIEIAGRCGRVLRIAAKVDNVDLAYFDTCIRPLLALPHVEFLGEISDPDKNEFLGRAHALLFPIDWPEPFGIVMIEAMACGTPVIAWREGSVAEVIDPGKSGYIVSSLEEAVSAVERCAELAPKTVRRVFEQRFTATHMALAYRDIYAKVIARRTAAPVTARRMPHVLRPRAALH